MSAFFRRITIFFMIILSFLFYNPVSSGAQAEPPGNETQNTVPQSKPAVEFQSLPADAMKAVIKDKLAFVTAGAAKLFIIDIQNPADLRQEACLDLPEAVSLIGIYGSYLYLPASNYLYIVDITDPASSEVHTPGPDVFKGASRGHCCRFKPFVSGKPKKHNGIFVDGACKACVYKLLLS